MRHVINGFLFSQTCPLMEAPFLDEGELSQFKLAFAVLMAMGLQNAQLSDLF